MKQGVSKIIKRIFVSIGVLLIGLILCIFLLTSTGPGLSLLARLISSVASNPQQTVSIKNIENIWKGRTKIGSLAIGDGDGEFASLENIEVVWTRFDLLTALFNADTVSIGKAELSRLPKSESDGKPFDLPVQISVRSFSAPQVVIGEQLAKQKIALAINGNLSLIANPLDASGKILITRSDKKDGSLNAEFALKPKQNLLSLDLGFIEPKGGVLATALDLPSSPPISLSLTGAGKLSDWQYQLRSEVNGQKAFDLAGMLRYSNSALEVQARGAGELAKLVPQKFRELLGGEIKIDLNASRDKTGLVKIQNAKLDASEFFVAAKGTFDPKGENNISGGVQAKNNTVSLPDGVLSGISNLEIHNVAFSINGPTENVSINASLDIPLIATKSASLAGLRAKLSSDNFSVIERKGDFVLRAETDRASAQDPTLDAIISAPFFMEAKAMIGDDVLAIKQASVRSAAISILGSGSAQLVEGSVSAELSGKMAGGIQSPIGKIIGKDLSFSASLTSNPTDTKIDEIKLDSSILSANGNASINAEQLFVTIQTRIDELNKIDPKLGGTAEITVNASGTMEVPDLDIGATSNVVSIQDRSLRDLAISIKGLANPAAPNLEVKLSGNLDGLPLTGGARYLMENGQRILRDLEIKNGDNTIYGELNISPENIPLGQLKLFLPNVDALAALALQDISGNVSGKIVFANSNDLPVISLKASSPQLKRQELALQDANIDLQIDNYVNQPQLSGKVKIGSLMQSGTSVRQIDLDLAALDGWTSFTGSAISDNIPISAKGRLRAANDTTTIVLDSARVNFRGIPISLAESSNISISNGVTSFERLPVLISGGAASIAGQVGQSLNLDIDLNRVNASLVNQFAPELGAQGSISGSAQVSGSPSSPKVVFDTSWTGASTRQLKELGAGALSISANGNLVNQTLSLSTAVKGQDGLAIGGQGTVSLEGNNALTMKFNGKLPFSILAAKLADNGLALQGIADVALVVGGSGSVPDIRGNIRSSSGRFIHASSGLVIKDLTTAIRFDGQNAVIEAVTGNLASGGNLSASGTIGLKGQIPADLNIKINNGVYTDGGTVNANFNANLKVTDSLVNTPLLSGKINLEKTVITVPEKLPDSISKLNVRHKNASQSVSQQAESLRSPSSEGGSGGARLNLTIKADQQVFIRGRGLDTELGGSMQVTGTTASPQTTGGFTTKRGRLSILGKRLDISNGNIGFYGSLIPELNITAQNQSDQVTVFVTVTGPANAPSFAFSSSPAMAEDEVMARLIFNRDIANLSPLQIAQLAQAAATLAGKGGNTSLLDRFQKLTKVDDLDIKTDSKTGETSVGVGSYVNDKTYVGIERGQSAGSGKARIDLNIGRGLKLRGEASESGTNKAGIFYEKDY